MEDILGGGEVSLTALEQDAHVAETLAPPLPARPLHRDRVITSRIFSL